MLATSVSSVVNEEVGQCSCAAFVCSGSVASSRRTCASTDTSPSLVSQGLGDSDLLLALRRVLHPRSTSARVDPLDIHHPVTDSLTEVEVTLTNLGDDLEQLLDARLELLNPESGLPATKDDEC